MWSRLIKKTLLLLEVSYGTRDIVATRYNEMKDVHRIEKETIEIKGTLIALDTKNKRFRLEEGSIRSGVVTDEFIKSGAVEIPKMYEATIDIEKKIDVNQRCYEVTYFLKKLV